MARSISRPATPATNEVPWETLPGPVSLPVCPRCGHIGKQPGVGSVTYACMGNPDHKHGRTRMVEITFYPDPEELE